jgi:hypothetical protein
MNDRPRYIISARTIAEFNVICNEKNLVPGTDAIFIPIHSPGHPIRMRLRGLQAPEPGLLIGEFHPNEVDLLLQRVPGGASKYFIDKAFKAVGDAVMDNTLEGAMRQNSIELLNDAWMLAIRAVNESLATPATAEATA